MSQYNYHEIEKLANEKEQENIAFRIFLKSYDGLSDAELDKLVFKITDKVSADIDCTSCGQCCRQLQPLLTPQDEQRLAARLAMTTEQLEQKYLEYEDSEGEAGWQIKKVPCPFLKSNKCSVYDDRPQNCRDYPYLHKPDFSYRTLAMLGRAFTCPIVFYVLEELKRELNFDADDFNDLMW